VRGLWTRTTIDSVLMGSGWAAFLVLVAVLLWHRMDDAEQRSTLAPAVLPTTAQPAQAPSDNTSSQWFLMSPPLSKDFFGLPDTSAPPERWVVRGTFDSETACEQARDRMHKALFAKRDPRKAKTPEVPSGNFDMDFAAKCFTRK
jgi:hypothetical protein